MTKFSDYSKLIIAIPITVLLLWGLFYFLSKGEKRFVYENSDSLQIANPTKPQTDDEVKMEAQTIETNGEEISNSKIEADERVEIDEKEKNNVYVGRIKSRLVSWGFDPSSNRKIDTIILHSSYNALGGDEYGLEKLIAEYKEYGVAPHYLIDRAGSIYRLVEDKNIAYHAGESQVPDGRSGVNGFSIGIELMNTKDDEYKKEQYEAVNWLIGKIKEDYNIKYILGHSEIAPERKTDPWNIDWSKVNR